MSINSEYLKYFVCATEKAAYGAFKYIGKKAKKNYKYDQLI